MYAFSLPDMEFQMEVILLDYRYTFPTHLLSLWSFLSSDNYNPSFKILKDFPEQLLINFTSQLSEPCSTPCSLDKLLTALNHYDSTSPGPSCVHYLILSHLHLQARSFYCPCTAVYGQRTWFQLPGEKQQLSLF